jgi:hypothetical protein
MFKHKLLTVIAAVMLSTAVAAEDAMCPEIAATKHSDNDTAASQECTSADKNCQADDVGVLNWLTDSHDMPSMHFIDFVEVFLH